jgi:hypothetical protein
VCIRPIWNGKVRKVQYVLWISLAPSVSRDVYILGRQKLRVIRAPSSSYSSAFCIAPANLKTMKLLIVIQFAGLLRPVLAGGQDSGSGCCKFTLSSSGPFSCPAGQLPDGQIRLNGSEPTSTFCIDKNGKITDQNGFGCIITGEFTAYGQGNLRCLT